MSVEGTQGIEKHRKIDRKARNAYFVSRQIEML